MFRGCGISVCWVTYKRTVGQHLAYSKLVGCSSVTNIGALIITHAILGVPYDSYSIMGPKTLFKYLRPLYYRASKVCR